MVRNIYLFLVPISGMELLKKKKPLEFSVIRTIMVSFAILMR